MIRLNPGNPTPPFDANSLLSDQVEAVQFYGSISEVPVRNAGLNVTCGVLVLHSRS
jgi:hypothetical protein